MSEFITIDTSIKSDNKIVYDAYKLVDEHDLILSQKTKQYVFSSDVNLEEIVERMILTAKINLGFGLAAPQCGLDHRIIVFGAEENYSVMINPEIVEKSEEQVYLMEGCLSFPFMYISIARPKEIVVRYQDINATVHVVKLVGMSARVVQHEIDHLDGVTFQSMAKPLALKQSLKRREKQKKLFTKQLIKNGTLIKK